MQGPSENRPVDVLSLRCSRILAALVKEYIRTAGPVSSKALTFGYSLGVSPATARNIMAELEEGGFLSQPHTSAGRVPTEKGFRLYVDSLLEPEEPRDMDKDLLKRCFDNPASVEEALMETTKVLSVLTSCAGLALLQRSDDFVIRHIRLLEMGENGLMALFVSNLGAVKTRFVRLENHGRLDLEKISNYLNAIGEGLTVRALRERIAGEMAREKNLYDEILSNAITLAVMALKDESGASPGVEPGGVYLEGASNILEQPEFRDDLDRMKKIFTAFEEKSLLVRILDKALDERVHVYMGSESTVKEFEGLSFVTAPSVKDGRLTGTLGVIGPVRMNYSKIVPLVEYTAGLLRRGF